MSKQKSTKTETRRFSGPELSELLDQVAREHGPDAAISAVNKIRSGGVAGFFCREEFEVVVKSPGPTPAVTPQRPQDLPAQAEAQPMMPEQANLTAPTPITNIGEPTAPTPAVHDATMPIGQLTEADPIHGSVTPREPRAVVGPSTDPLRLLLNQSDDRPSSAMSGRAESAAHDQVDQNSLESRHETSDDGQDQQVFGGPRQQETNWTDTRFRALVDRRLDEASTVETLHAQRHPRRPVPEQPVLPPLEQPNLQPLVPTPGLAMLTEHASGIGIMNPTSGSLPDFWLRLQRTQHELASFMPSKSFSVATIGPLSLTNPIVQRLRSRPGLESADVIVLTNRAEIVSEPSWELVRSGNQLLDVVAEKGDWPTLILIDVPVELPNWVAPLENRLRLSGVGLFRYAVPGDPSVSQMDRYRLGSDVPYVIDLVSRVEPERLVEFISLRHPIASVAGADLNAELLVAMREQVGIGP